MPQLYVNSLATLAPEENHGTTSWQGGWPSLGWLDGRARPAWQCHQQSAASSPSAYSTLTPHIIYIHNNCDHIPLPPGHTMSLGACNSFRWRHLRSYAAGQLSQTHGAQAFKSSSSPLERQFRHCSLQLLAAWLPGWDGFYF